MKLTDHQRRIITAAQANGNAITKKEAVALIGGYYYCNADKHVGDVLSRMVTAGLLIREKPGVFTVGKGKIKQPIPHLPNQQSLF